jgi:lipid II:glycine glycyltransferase (peptidoglycan interpeptide bridge formation enzyme)
VRPWEQFKAAIYPSVQNDCAVVLLAEHDSEIVSTIVVLFGGTRGYYVMGGTKRVKLDKMYPAQRLQYTAMQETLERGYMQYDLTSIVPGGVADFKRGFRPIYYRLTAPYLKIYQPCRFRLYKTLYPYLKRKKYLISKLLYATGLFTEKK